MRIPSPGGSLAVRGTVRQQLCDWLLADGNSESNWIRRKQRDAFIIADSLASSRERVQGMNMVNWGMVGGHIMIELSRSSTDWLVHESLFPLRHMIPLFYSTRTSNPYAKLPSEHQTTECDPTQDATNYDPNEANK